MSALKSSILLIGSWKPELVDLGAKIVHDLSQFLSVSKSQSQSINQTDEFSYNVIGVPITTILEKKFQSFYQNIKNISPSTQWIAVVPKDYSRAKLVELHNSYHFFKVLESVNDLRTEGFLIEAISEAQRLKQNENIEKLIQEQNSMLKKLQQELELRVEKRSKTLMESRRKLYITTSRLENLKEILLTIHQAASLPELEKRLTDALATSAKTTWIRICLHPQDIDFARQTQEMPFQKIQIPLFKNQEKIGSVFYMREEQRAFIKEEVSFLDKVSEAVSLALDRINNLQTTESLKEQWDATFNAISDPICITNPNYEILQANKAFFDTSKDKKVLGQKCYEVLYSRSSPCHNCQRGQSFKLSEKHHFYDVYSQEISFSTEEPVTYVNMYHDITEKIQMENKLIETAKLAELGTIGSSIAHELNNPLGGMLSFAQLIKMDLKKEDPIYTDIVEIEKGVLRCKEIIQTLLTFTRSPELNTDIEISLKEVCAKAIKIIELQSKSAGIPIELNVEPENSLTLIKGNLNLLSQTVKNCIQLSFDAINLRRSTEKLFAGKINIKIFYDSKNINLVIQQNGCEWKNPNINKGLNLQLSRQVLHDHQAKLDFEDKSLDEHIIKITFPRLVL